MLYQPMTDDQAVDAWVTAFLASCENTAPAADKAAAMAEMDRIKAEYPQAWHTTPQQAELAEWRCKSRLYDRALTAVPA